MALGILLSAVDRNSIVDIFSRTHRSNQHLTHQAGHCTGETSSVNFSLFCVIPRLTLRFYYHTYCSLNLTCFSARLKVQTMFCSTFFFCENTKCMATQGVRDSVRCKNRELSGRPVCETWGRALLRDFGFSVVLFFI